MCSTYCHLVSQNVFCLSFSLSVCVCVYVCVCVRVGMCFVTTFGCGGPTLKCRPCVKMHKQCMEEVPTLRQQGQSSIQIGKGSLLLSLGN